MSETHMTPKRAIALPVSRLRGGDAGAPRRPRTAVTALLATGAALGVLLGDMLLGDAPEANAQDIQITGPLAGQPAVRRLRLHREDRFDIAVHGTFTLLDEFRRHIMPGLRLNYHFTDWLGIGVFGGYMFSYNTALSEEIQDKAINQRSCEQNPNSSACRLSAVNLCRGEDCFADNQLGNMQWYVAPQLTLVPFRGKLSLFGAAFLDTDISFFVGPAFIGVNERAECRGGACADPASFTLEHRVAIAPTFGLGFNFYPLDFMGFGSEFRLTPFEWNTSGFDVAQDGSEFPDQQVDNHDRVIHFNPMLSVFVSFQLPSEIKVTD
jgi:hypothetical protein